MRYLGHQGSPIALSHPRTLTSSVSTKVVAVRKVMRKIASKLSKAEKFRLATTMIQKPYSTRNAKQVKKKERAPTYLEEAITEKNNQKLESKWMK